MEEKNNDNNKSYTEIIGEKVGQWKDSAHDTVQYASRMLGLSSSGTPENTPPVQTPSDDNQEQPIHGSDDKSLVDKLKGGISEITDSVSGFTKRTLSLSSETAPAKQLPKEVIEDPYFDHSEHFGVPEEKKDISEKTAVKYIGESLYPIKEGISNMVHSASMALGISSPTPPDNTDHIVVNQTTVNDSESVTEPRDRLGENWEQLMGHLDKNNENKVVNIANPNANDEMEDTTRTTGTL